MSSKKSIKSRYFTFILYPESIPDDWMLKLELIGVPIAISPLHDSDKSDAEDREFKKPHYHVVYIANNPVTAESVRLKIKRALGNKSISHVQIIATNVENAYLYLTHESKDAIAKHKHVYPKSDIKHLNNFDIDRYITQSIEDKEDMLNLLCDIINTVGLANMRELIRYIDSNGQYHGINSMRQVNDVVRTSTGLVKMYFDGVYQDRLNRATNTAIDPETGEIIQVEQVDQGR